MCRRRARHNEIGRTPIRKLLPLHFILVHSDPHVNDSLVLGLNKHMWRNASKNSNTEAQTPARSDAPAIRAVLHPIYKVEHLQQGRAAFNHDFALDRLSSKAVASIRAGLTTRCAG
jgi:hypothetical protein